MFGRAAFALGLCFLLGSPAAADGRVEGVWGVVGNNGAPKCSGTAVLVFEGGTYSRVLPKLGTLEGVRSHIMGQAGYTISGDELEVAPVLSWTAPEPRRLYLIKRGPDTELVRQGEAGVTLRRCRGMEPSRLISR